MEKSAIIYKRMGKGGLLRVDRGGYNNGRGNGNLGKAQFVRELIAADAKQYGISKAAESWDCSLTSAYSYKDGRNGTHTKKGSNEETVKKSEEILKDRQVKIIESTTLKLMEVMESMNVKLISSDPLKQSILAKNLATVAEKMNNNGGNRDDGVTFIVHVPKLRKVEDFGEAVRVIEAEVIKG